MYIRIIILICVTGLLSCNSANNTTDVELNNDITKPLKQNYVAVFLSAAPVDKATCDIYKIVNGKAAAISLQTVSSSFGHLKFIDIDYQGPALLKCVGGYYYDEATDKEKISPPLHVVINFTKNGSFTITPLTEIAFQMSDNLNTVLKIHNKTVAKAFGIKNIISIQPTDINNTIIQNNQSGHYAIVLAVLSQMEKDGNEGSNLSELIINIKNDLSANNTLDNLTMTNLFLATDSIKKSTSTFIANIDRAILEKVKENILTTNVKFIINDTGVNNGAKYAIGNNIICDGINILAQDCSNGRDASALVGDLQKTGNGMAGFDFTKVGFDGTILEIQDKVWKIGGTGSEAKGTKWSCVKDNVTGYIWEVKTDAGVADNNTSDFTNTNIHHQDNTYRWGGWSASGKNHRNKKGIYYDDWKGIII